jgi:hypothetical protein
MDKTVEQYTRHDLVAYLEGATDAQGGIVREQALRLMKANGAPDGLVLLFADRVPEGGRIASLRGLWDYFGDLPISWD